MEPCLSAAAQWSRRERERESEAPCGWWQREACSVVLCFSKCLPRSSRSWRAAEDLEHRVEGGVVCSDSIRERCGRTEVRCGALCFCGGINLKHRDWQVGRTHYWSPVTCMETCLPSFDVQPLVLTNGQLSTTVPRTDNRRTCPVFAFFTIATAMKRNFILAIQTLHFYAHLFHYCFPISIAALKMVVVMFNSREMATSNNHRDAIGVSHTFKEYTRCNWLGAAWHCRKWSGIVVHNLNKKWKKTPMMSDMLVKRYDRGLQTMITFLFYSYMLHLHYLYIIPWIAIS